MEAKITREDFEKLTDEEQTALFLELIRKLTPYQQAVLLQKMKRWRTQEKTVKIR